MNWPASRRRSRAANPVQHLPLKPRLTAVRFSLAAVVFACALLPLADLAIHTATPGDELRRMLAGLLHPEVAGWELLARGIGLTFAFGLLGTLLAAPVGLLMALFWQRRAVRVLAASLRSIHRCCCCIYSDSLRSPACWQSFCRLAAYSPRCMRRFSPSNLTLR